ncbi:complement receptor type 2-like isoform X6 [Dermacentor variabilis]|uniref:complement receptor type 2-like isoform X6 n=1 Tax=Dermacentor variabilis TaxID=34621 RepID=UPI003F5AEB0D
MQSWRWHVILLQIMLLLVLLALLAVADCSWDELTENTLHYEGNYTTRAFKDTFKDGEIAPYKCQNGYHVSGLYSGPHVLNATCRGNKWEFDSRNLVCKAVSCSHPCPGGSCQNGAVYPPVFNFPNFVNFTCNPGYHLVTHDDQKWDPSYKVYCTSSGKWSRPAPKCVEVVCPQPSPIANGQVSPSKPVFRENDVIQYTCDQPYMLNGDATRRCQNDATWSGGEPICETPGTTTCPRPGSIVNGGVDVPPGTLGVNAKIRYRCDAGYTLVGVAERVCQGDGSWSNSEPVCQAVVATTCPTPASVTNGAVDVPPGTLGVNTKVRYQCNAGYTLVGVTERVCQMDGSWSGLEPYCQATGQAPQPPQPPQPPAAPTTSQSPMPGTYGET